MLAARRRVLQQQVADLVEQARTDDDDGYEEICFGGGEAEASKDSKMEEINHHYMTPISILERNRSPLESSRKSISDTDLLAIMDENREIELHQLTNSINSDAVNSVVASSSVIPTDRTFGREPEQGFYRVYDELDRVKEWHLIPYVIARKAKLEEEEAKKQVEAKAVTTVKPCASSAGSDKVSVKSEGTTSRVSVDSGRASVMSADNKKANGGNSVEDAGSNCSADSGTYNLYDEQQQQQQQHRSSEFLNKVSQQLDSCMGMRARSKSTASTSTSSRRRTPPPPPTLASASSRDSSPPPLPPRSKTTATGPATRRKDLSSFFGLLQDEPNQLLSKRVARSVAMRNLTSSSSSPLKYASSLESSPPGKKDLKKYLGIHDGSREGTMVRHHGSASSLLKCLGGSPGSVLQRSLRKLSPKQLEFVQKREEEMQEVLDRVLVSPPPKKQQNHVRRVLDFEDSALFREDGQSSKKNNANMTRCGGSEVFLVGNTPPSRVTKVEATKAAAAAANQSI